MYKPEITLRVNEHLKEAQQYFDNDHIVGIFLQGSQNYGTDTEFFRRPYKNRTRYFRQPRR